MLRTKGSQPPSGGCVLKQAFASNAKRYGIQPPSGGCVLKLYPISSVILVTVVSRLRAAVC